VDLNPAGERPGNRSPRAQTVVKRNRGILIGQRVRQGHQGQRLATLSLTTVWRSCPGRDTAAKAQKLSECRLRGLRCYGGSGIVRLARLQRELFPQKPLSNLSSRESDVLALVEQGRSNKEIARQLAISTATVKHRMHNILQKLQVSRRGQAAARLRGSHAA